MSKTLKLWIRSFLVLTMAGMVSFVFVTCGKKNKSGEASHPSAIVDQVITGTEAISLPFSVGGKQMAVEIPDPSILPPGTKVLVKMSTDDAVAKIKFGAGTILPLERVTVGFVNPNNEPVSIASGTTEDPLAVRGKLPYIAMSGQANQIVLKLDGTQLYLGTRQSPNVAYSGGANLAAKGMTLAEASATAPKIDMFSVPGASTSVLQSTIVLPLAAPLALPNGAGGSLSLTDISNTSTTTKFLGNLLEDTDVIPIPVTDNGGQPYSIAAAGSSTEIKTTAMSPTARTVEPHGASLSLVFDRSEIEGLMEALKGKLEAPAATALDAFSLELLITAYDCSNPAESPATATITNTYATDPTAELKVGLDFASVVTALPAFSGEKCINYQNTLRLGAKKTSYAASDFPFALQISVTGFPATVAESLALIQEMPDDLKAICDGPSNGLNECLSAIIDYPTVRITCTDSTRANCTLKYSGQDPAPIPAPTYMVTYDSNGSTGGSVPTDASKYHISDTVTVLQNTGTLVKTGYTFTSWNTLANGTGTTYAPAATFAMPAAAQTLYATWTSAENTTVASPTPSPEPSVALCTATGTVTRADTGVALPGVAVSASPSAGEQATSGASGTYSLKIKCKVATTLTFVISSYNNLSQSVTIETGSKTADVSMVSTSFGTGAYVVTLNWAATPADLDTYVIMSGSAASVTYSNKGDITVSPYVTLDTDDTNGYGPETIRIAKNSTSSDQLKYAGNARYVVNALGSNFNGTTTVARLYKEGVLVQTWTLDNAAGSSLRYWHVFDIANSGAITSVNTLSGSLPGKP